MGSISGNVRGQGQSRRVKVVLGHVWLGTDRSGDVAGSGHGWLWIHGAGSTHCRDLRAIHEGRQAGHDSHSLGLVPVALGCSTVLALLPLMTRPVHLETLPRHAGPPLHRAAAGHCKTQVGGSVLLSVYTARHNCCVTVYTAS